MSDLAIIENGDGGDLKIVGNDFATQSGWGNMPYLALFGGNVEASTVKRLATQQAFDFWANSTLFDQDESVQMDSETERVLMEVALNSAGRIKIQQAVEKDLKFMEAFAIVKVSVTIEGIDRVNITIKVKEPDNLKGRSSDQFRAFIFIWDATKKELGDFSISDFNDDFFI
jgi:hypothetical protein